MVKCKQVSNNITFMIRDKILKFKQAQSEYQVHSVTTIMSETLNMLHQIKSLSYTDKIIC